MTRMPENDEFSHGRSVTSASDGAVPLPAAKLQTPVGAAAGVREYGWSLAWLAARGSVKQRYSQSLDGAIGCSVSAVLPCAGQKKSKAECAGTAGLAGVRDPHCGCPAIRGTAGVEGVAGT